MDSTRQVPLISVFLLALIIHIASAKPLRVNPNDWLNIEGQEQGRRLLSTNVFLSNATQLSLIIPLAPLSIPPTPPTGYTSGQMRRWKFMGGDGYLLITRNQMPAGTSTAILNEMFYFPGLYQPVCSSDSRPYLSAQRVWADQQLSMLVGRTYWGFPKEQVGFTWGPNSLTVKARNTIIFTITLEANLQTSLLSNIMMMPTWLTTWADTDTTTMQWPISDTYTRIFIRAINNPSASVAASLAGLPQDTQQLLKRAADYGSLTTRTSKPNVQTLDFPNYTQLAVTQATQVVFNTNLFTGNRGQQIALMAGNQVGVIIGTPGHLSDPASFSCY